MNTSSRLFLHCGSIEQSLKEAMINIRTRLESACCTLFHRLYAAEFSAADSEAGSQPRDGSESNGDANGTGPTNAGQPLIFPPGRPLHSPQIVPLANSAPAYPSLTPCHETLHCGEEGGGRAWNSLIAHWTALSVLIVTARPGHPLQ